MFHDCLHRDSANKDKFTHAILPEYYWWINDLGYISVKAINFIPILQNSPHCCVWNCVSSVFAVPLLHTICISILNNIILFLCSYQLQIKFKFRSSSSKYNPYRSMSWILNSCCNHASSRIIICPPIYTSNTHRTTSAIRKSIPLRHRG